MGIDSISMRTSRLGVLSIDVLPQVDDDRFEVLSPHIKKIQNRSMKVISYLGSVPYLYRTCSLCLTLGPEDEKKEKDNHSTLDADY